MSYILANILIGKLSFNALPHDMITAGGALMVVGAVVSFALFMTITKRWTWLWREWITAVDPKKIGIMYIIIALIMLVRGGVDALMMRAQQATSVGASHGILSANHFQQVFSAHGTIMIFFVAMGLMFGIINLILPLQIGSRDVAFPFLNNLSLWLFMAGVVLVNMSLVIGNFSAAGWLAYPPLSELTYSPGVGVDYWIWSLEIAGIGSLLSAINFFVTIIKLRCPGMTLMKMPMYVWTVLGSMTLVMFAFPILTATLTLLYLDRTIGTHFFTAGHGGNMMMYVNLIWAWGHPEVYILVLPAFGIFSEIVATFSRKKLFGYTSMVWATWAIVLLSFTVWVHHFFTMGAGADVNAFFGIATMIIAIPTGVKIFNWLATMYGGRIHFHSSMLWFIGFIILFTIGGIAGVILSVPAIDFQLHNSLFLVAHFHMMIVSGVLFGYFAGINYWFPKIFGFKLNERIAKIVFWLWFIGFSTAFIPLYILGFMGATRRLDHYSTSSDWQPLFIVAAIGAVIIALAVFMQFIQLGYSIWKRHDNLDTSGDPWNGRTLEWSVPSPAPFYNFSVLPQVTDRDAFWTIKNNKKLKQQDMKNFENFLMPKNTSAGVLIAFAALSAGFAAVWHIWWLFVISLIFALVIFIRRVFNEETYFMVNIKLINKYENK